MTPQSPAPAVPVPPSATTRATAIPCPRPSPLKNSTALPVRRATDTHSPIPAPPPPLKDLKLGALPPPGPRHPRLVVCPRPVGAPPLGEVGPGSQSKKKCISLPKG